MRRGEAPSKVYDRGVDISGEVGDCSRDGAPVLAVPAEKDRKASNHEPNFVVVEVCPSTGTERRNTASLQGGEIPAAMVLPHAVQEQRDLAVVLDDITVLQEVDEVGEATGLVPRMLPPYSENGRIVGVLRLGVGIDCLVVPEGNPTRIGPAGRSHPAVVGLDDRLMRAVVGR